MIMAKPTSMGEYRRIVLYIIDRIGYRVNFN